MKPALAIVLAALSLAAFAALAPGADEKKADAAAADTGASGSADAMFKELKDMKPPKFDRSRSGDTEYVQSAMKQMKEASKKRAELAKKFVEKYPKDPRKADALYMRAESLAGAQAPPAEFTEVTKAFIEAAPKDDRGAMLLYHAASLETDSAKQGKIYRQIVDNYANSEVAAMAKAPLRQLDGVGKPFELEFTDAISGKKISMKDLKGKVVVVDFWATWCGPCVGEMPHMKELYAKYKDKGVEFLGVSLDNPDEGLTRLKDFVKKNDITWPQYYQGKGWQSEFSKSWGINSIPAVFIIDAAGKLHSPSARGQLETLIPELLKKAGKKAA